MDPKYLVTLTAILCITGLEMCALYCGIDGKVLTFVVAALAGATGFGVKSILNAAGLELRAKK